MYIETENGITKNHPAFKENLIQAFGKIPAHWEPFTRVERPVIGIYQLMDPNEAVYTKVNGVWTDVWTVREMTAEEKAAKQQAARDVFNENEYASNWSSWTLDETTNVMVPPIPRPAADQIKLNAGILTVWCGADANWKDTPVKPTDGNEYRFNFFTWEWVQVVN